MDLVKNGREGADSPQRVEAGADKVEVPTDFSDFKDSCGRYRTESLFVEKSRNDRFKVYYTLKDKEHKGYVSLKAEYLKLEDPTEYMVALKCFGSYDHWQVLAQRKWFLEHLTQWRLELQASLESKAISALKDIVTDPKASGRAAAAKMLVERPWEDKKPIRGRPSKQEIENYKKKAASDSEEVSEDYDRIFGKVTNYNAR